MRRWPRCRQRARNTDKPVSTLDYTVLRAPFAGIITQRFVHVGEAVQAGPPSPQPLIAMQSLQDLRVNVQVPQSAVDAIRRFHCGRRVARRPTTRVAWRRAASTFFRMPTRKPTRSTCACSCPAADSGLYPGMTVKVAFATGDAKRLLMPASALVQRGEIVGVYVIEEHEVMLRQVRTGRRDGNQVEILAGLDDGERIAADPVAAMNIWPSPHRADAPPMNEPHRLGISGRIARAFQVSQITPLLALAGLLLGIAATIITPKEEDPQIEVTMANVLVPFPGASVSSVENLVTFPLEQKLSEIKGVKHVYSMSQPGMAVVTVEFKVGVPRQEALVRLYNKIYSNADLGAARAGRWPAAGETAWHRRRADDGADAVVRSPGCRRMQLAKVAHTLETDLKRIPGTRDVYTIGAPDRAVMVEIEPARLAATI